MTASVPGAVAVLAAAAHHAGSGAARAAATGTAAAHSAGQAVTTAPTVSAGHLLLQLVLGLAVVIGLVLVAKRMVRGRGAGGLAGAGGGRRNPVRVVGRQSLGKGVSVAVVEFGDQAYLVGVTPNAVRRLAATDARRVAEAVEAREAARRAAPAGAPTVLRALHQVAPALAARLDPGTARAVPLPEGGATVLDLVPVAGSTGTTPAGAGSARTRSTAAGDGTARTRNPNRSGARPAPTWTSAIEHLRERTVRRA